ncbi:hypothetical protein [Bradyrhizobium prioriisuperbiae]|uniref:hypothetical protein n=1 Tax=Bradyrhizobium prioriisuperbiae TaxID=2854389 RepID=UPI0028E91F6A|nr:hypothetical protein [Bradyrhizobium prioritasuperba]
MSASVELICVDPRRIHEIWPHAADLIHRAVRRTNLNHTRDIDADVLSGAGLLWLAWNGEAIEAAATTSLIQTDTDKVCILTACGGEDMARWLPLLRQIEDYARNEGCACVRIYGRRGWQRVLDGYDVTHVILEKELT